MKNESPISRALRSLDGLSMGDAFGQRFFGDPVRAERRIAERELPEGPWFWTDDTEMALAIVELLGAHGAIDRDLLAKIFASRYVREPNRGYGAGAHQLLSEIARGAPWREASRNLFEGMGSFGNGGAMRVGPIGAYFSDDLDALVENARHSAEVTHAHAEGQAGAIAVALAAGYACRGEQGDFFEFVLARTPAGETRAMIEVASRIAPDASVALAANALGTGARVSSMDTVPFSLWCARRHLDDFEAAMWNTVSGLGDRDTTCAIVGSIVGLRAEPPEAWCEAREPIEEDPVVARLAR
ncbi:MAG: ADP-ribosylglycohydrolase family protein [Polyangiales bacterium]